MLHFLNVLHNAPRSDQLTMLAAAASMFLIVAAVVLPNPL
jgi:hypothetical protein